MSEITLAIRSPLGRRRSMSETNSRDRGRDRRDQGDERRWDDDEAPVPDAVEQHTPVLEEDESPELPAAIPFDASEADATDQERPVHLDEDDYR
jgi:hypothetical protein